MKASILISSYLLKDIWHRWCDNPGALGARLVIALLLALLLIVLRLAFLYSENLLRDKVVSLGVHNMIIRNSVSASVVRTPDEILATKLAPLWNYGDLLVLQRIAGQARGDLTGDMGLYLYTPESLTVLSPLIQEAGGEGVVVVQRQWPAGLPVEVLWGDFSLMARTAIWPRGFHDLIHDAALLLLPADTYSWLSEQGYQEIIVFLGDPARISNLRDLAEGIKQLFELDTHTAELQSAAGWLEELDRLQERQRDWGALLGIFCGLVVMVVYGAITLLEYQQNVFLAALIRSFGIPAPLLLARYWMESLFFILVAYGLATVLLGNALPYFADWFQMPAAGFKGMASFLYSQAGLLATLPWLIAGATLSMLPTAMAMRKPVGRLL